MKHREGGSGKRAENGESREGKLQLVVYINKLLKEALGAIKHTIEFTEQNFKFPSI